MNWKDINKELPKRGHGWFAAAVLPRNHSGSGETDATDLEGDNNWRASFGFIKAWYNNGEWFEADNFGQRSKNITRFVTHWDELPNVPNLKESFVHRDDWRFGERPYLDSFKEVVEERIGFEKESVKSTESYTRGFLSALHWLGLC